MTAFGPPPTATQTAFDYKNTAKFLKLILISKQIRPILTILAVLQFFVCLQMSNYSLSQNREESPINNSLRV